MIKHVNIKISGKVQGVFFRASARDKAQELGVRGFVRNEQDGCVYIEAEGDEAQLEQMISWCWEGPSGARVDKIDVEDGADGKFKIFEVRR